MIKYTIVSTIKVNDDVPMPSDSEISEAVDKFLSEWFGKLGFSVEVKGETQA